MTDVSDGSGQIPRRSPRVSDGGAPVSGALALILAFVAVLAGFFILRSISDSGDTQADFPPVGTGGAASDDDADDDAAGDDAAGDDGAVATLPTTTTEPPIITEGAAVIVANANGTSGSASAMSRAIETGAGFTVVDPVNSSATIGDIDQSVIYFDPTVPAAQTVAESLGRVLGGVGTIAPMPDTPPTADGTLNDAAVLLMLGNDKAGKTLAELAPDESGTPVVVTNPPVAGSIATTDG